MIPRLEDIASHAFSITASADPLPKPTKNGIHCGGAGNVTVTMLSGASVQFAVIAGQHLRVCATHVTAATATGLIGLA